MSNISLCLDPNLKHTKIIESLSISVVSGKDIQAFIHKLCRAQEIIMYYVLRTTKFFPTKKIVCPTYTTVH